MKEKIRKETEAERKLRLDKLREDTIKRDLTDLPSEAVYLKESKYTKEWSCSTCGGPIPCSIDCPQCGRPRPVGNGDPEQEGWMGIFRKKAKTRRG